MMKRKGKTPAGELWEFDPDDMPTQPIPRPPEPSGEGAAGGDEDEKDRGR